MLPTFLPERYPYGHWSAGRQNVGEVEDVKQCRDQQRPPSVFRLNGQAREGIAPREGTPRRDTAFLSSSHTSVLRRDPPLS
jgi:hypothetical protein